MQKKHILVKMLAQKVAPITLTREIDKQPAGPKNPTDELLRAKDDLLSEGDKV